MPQDPKPWNGSYGEPEDLESLGELEDLYDYWKIKEVAGVLRVTNETVRRMIRKGMLPAVRVGNRLLVHREDVRMALQPIFRGKARKLEGERDAGKS